MNQSNNETGMNLPQPVGEMPLTVPAENGPSAPAEHAPSAGERSPAATAAALALPAMPLPMTPNPQQQAPQNDVTVTTSTGLPSVVDDSDLIEKEWVEKAKQIVERNRDDPYKQSEELTVVKADYLKQRYGKTIKLS